MKNFFNQHRLIFLIYGSWFLTCLILILIFGNVSISSWVNTNHNYLLDSFFKYFTHLGDGIIALILIIILILLRLDYGFHAIIGFSLSSSITQFLKRVVFKDTMRPSVYFNDLIEQGSWHLIDGVQLHQLYSFPSGHTTSIFSVCVLLSLFTNSHKIKYSLSFVAILTGLSRIYLSQHFLVDVFVGSVIGFSAVIISYLILNPRFSRFSKISLLKYMK